MELRSLARMLGSAGNLAVSPNFSYLGYHDPVVYLEANLPLRR